MSDSKVKNKKGYCSTMFVLTWNRKIKILEKIESGFTIPSDKKWVKGFPLELTNENGKVFKSKVLCKNSGLKWFYSKKKIKNRPYIQLRDWIKFIKANRKQIYENIKNGATATLDFYFEGPINISFLPEEMLIISKNKIEINMTDYG